MKAGDKIMINWKDFGGMYDDVQTYTVEEFRHNLGIFTSDEHREAGRFTPLCELYCNGPDSEHRYISNFGNYWSNQVQGWSDLP